VSRPVHAAAASRWGAAPGGAPVIGASLALAQIGMSSGAAHGVAQISHPAVWDMT